MEEAAERSPVRMTLTVTEPAPSDTKLLAAANWTPVGTGAEGETSALCKM